MSLSPEARARIESEEETLARVISELQSQQTADQQRFYREAHRAKELSSQIVASRRDVDKQLLASDEAVAHGVTKIKKEDLDSVEKLLERPYFARIVLEEEEEQGGTKRIEFRLGQSSNLECRIIDWRKAPLSKLYYEYQEGDEYSEEIQGKERNGRVLLRNKVGIEAGELKSLSCPLGSFEKKGNDWAEAGHRKRSGGASSYGQLPDVLSLITADQFRTITEDSDRAVLIQGVAGSGKTTIAIHRLAWILEAKQAELKPEDCAVVVLSPGLQAYIQRSLGALGVSIRVFTYLEWIAPTVIAALGLAPSTDLAKLYPQEQPAPGIRRVLRSLALLKTVERIARDAGPEQSERQILLSALSRSDLIIVNDETKLLDRELITLAKAYVEGLVAKNLLHPLEYPLIGRLYQLRRRSFIRSGGAKSFYRHLIADEVQDYFAPELATLIGAVEKVQQLTLVGDTSQASRERSPFPVWDKLREHWAFGDSLSHFVTLAVSHRSTGAIMRLAHAIQGTNAGSGGRPGKPPLWYLCETESQAVGESISWLERVTARYPNSVTAVVCRDEREARYVESLLRPTFGPVVSTAENGNLEFNEGIVVTAIEFVKGLEFPNVLLWNPSAEAFPAKDRSRNLLYIAVTRAEEHLCIATHGKPSPLLPSINSPIVRGMQRRVEDDLAEETEEPLSYD